MNSKNDMFMVLFASIAILIGMIVTTCLAGCTTIKPSGYVEQQQPAWIVSCKIIIGNKPSLQFPEVETILNRIKDN